MTSREGLIVTIVPIEMIVAMVRNLLAVMIVAIGFVATIALIPSVVAIMLIMCGERGLAESRSRHLFQRCRHQCGIEIR